MFRAVRGLPLAAATDGTASLSSSMSGLFSAAFLRQIGWDSGICSSAPASSWSGRGAGVTGHLPELMEALEASGTRHPKCSASRCPSASPSTVTAVPLRQKIPNLPGTACSTLLAPDQSTKRVRLAGISRRIDQDGARRARSFFRRSAWTRRSPDWRRNGIRWSVRAQMAQRRCSPSTPAITSGARGTEWSRSCP